MFLCARGAHLAFCVHAHLGMCVHGMRCKTCTVTLLGVCMPSHTHCVCVCIRVKVSVYVYL